ncbi:MetQ/NlpA family ABC transporter substrate-binding protein [Alkalibacillus haloalkaliphilus]|uniref:MetQ/NlpA family ABC transporter substrate-binding protein n=1 Tax=Alkalibacillus haloalkaliphilus TaxID=94136 RepID=UPI0029365316|nr:MetQ/NlpA family ABC transporter substrate-binding protein [Alkalibacillus haloalkaliphilus]MDV2581488.1 MetQ/NlpA family ABC transporter substrate-binding protein [Alkalibacillus haloalkaliphilus]
MKTTIKALFGAIILTIILAGCGSSDETIKVGLNGSGVPLWEEVADIVYEEEGVELELIEFADYVRPNMALEDGDVDINAFQTVSYFDEFIEEHDLSLEPIGTTYIAPMAIYSEEHESIEEVPDGGIVALPQEATNMGRALLLLEEAGLIELEEGFNGYGELDKIVENPKELEFEPVVAAQTPRVLPDVDLSVINNGVAREADFQPNDDSIFIEGDTATPYINIIAAREEDTDREILQRISEIVQTEQVEEEIIELYDEALIPVFVDLEEIGW